MEASVRPLEGESLPLVRRRELASLGAVVLVLALLVCCAALSPWAGHPLLSLLNAETLPATLTVAALALAVFLAPVWAVGAERRAGKALLVLGRGAFAGAWQGAALGFFLLTSARLTPLPGPDVLRCVCVVALTAALLVFLAEAWPRAYAGLVFAWCIGVPAGCYILAEVFLTTPAGGFGWAQAQEPGLHGLVARLLALSPGTAATGALGGRLVGGGAFGWFETSVFAACCVLLSGALLRRMRTAASAGPA